MTNVHLFLAFATSKSPGFGSARWCLSVIAVGHNDLKTWKISDKKYVTMWKYLQFCTNKTRQIVWIWNASSKHRIIFWHQDLSSFR